MAAKKFTEFPTLSYRKDPCEEADVVERLIDVGVDISPYPLTISWALLLRSYTDEKTPIFKSNGRSIAVNIQEWDTSSVQDVINIIGSRCTGISSLEAGFPRL